MKTAAQIIIEKELDIFNEEVKNRLKAKNLNNTLELFNSLRVEKTENGAASIGLEYIEFLDRGRRPGGKMAPKKEIFDWVKSKMGIENDKDAERITFFIRRKQVAEGSSIFQDKTKGLQLTEVIEKLQSELPEKVGFAYSTEIKNNLYDYWKRKGVTF